MNGGIMLFDALTLFVLIAILPVTSQHKNGLHGYRQKLRSSEVMKAYPVSSVTTAPKRKEKITVSNNIEKRNVTFLQSILQRLPPSPSLSNKTRLNLLRKLVSKNVSCAFVYLKTIDANGTQYYDPDVRLQDVNVQVLNQYDGVSGEAPQTAVDNYDQQGAMYFAVAVITIYGLSIALLIASSMRRSDEDYELKGFIRSFAQLDGSKTKKPREKYKIQKALLESGILFRLTAQGLPRKVLPHFLECASPVSPAAEEFIEKPKSDPGEGEASKDEQARDSGIKNCDEDKDCVTGCAEDCSVDLEEDCGATGVDCPVDSGFAESDNIDSVSDVSVQTDVKEPVEPGSPPKASVAASGPRRVKIYQGKENGKIDVRSVEVAVDIPEDSII